MLHSQALMPSVADMQLVGVAYMGCEHLVFHKDVATAVATAVTCHLSSAHRRDIRTAGAARAVAYSNLCRTSTQCKVPSHTWNRIKYKSS